MRASLGSWGTISLDFVHCLLWFPISIKSFGMDAGFTFITAGWTSASGSVITEVHENHKISEQPNKEVQHCVKKTS